MTAEQSATPEASGDSATPAAHAEHTSSNGAAGTAPPVRHNPTDFAISLAQKGGALRLLAADQGKPRQELPGFEATYVDIVDYIVRVTHRIWEQKDIGYIYDTYRHNSRVTDDSGLRYGRDKIVADTVHTINAFPDVRLFADEVIWAFDDGGSFHTSHRTVIAGHNTGFSRWGPPTGRQILVWCTANCVARENEIYEEWVIYNNGLLLSQLGFDLREVARAGAPQRTVTAQLIEERGGEIERLLGQAPPQRMPMPTGPGLEVEPFLRAMMHNVWNRRELSAIDLAYAPNVRVHGATGRELYGRGALKAFVLSMLAMFPDLGLQVDDLYWMGNERDGHSVSMRWTALGTHTGNGIYGPPTNRRALLWGISQFHMRGGVIREEWTVFNELDVLSQLLAEDPLTLQA